MAPRWPRGTWLPRRAPLGGRIDILVNNAGIFPSSATATTDEATFDEVYTVNVKAPYFLTAAVAPAMADAGGGAIINLGSWIVRLAVRARCTAPPRAPSRP